ncbi:GNAT family N-acetyltransferase [Roseimarinus sediminis]|uniref:GNAT family N-acetyltransferase n=1 Tax=Roseimarinus sediminis TaxID=1610899 RepID=UPI003D1F0048
MITIRRSVVEDLSLLQEAEQVCFPSFQRSSKRTLQLSLSSAFQEVWIAEIKQGKQKVVAGMLILHLHPRTLRIYSIAVLPQFQGKGVGARLLTHACSLGLAKGCERVSLEARCKDETLVAWYKKFGFQITETLIDYYIEGEDAWRMIFVLSRPKSRDSLSNLIVVDHPSKLKFKTEGVRVISSKSYITDAEFQSNRNYRVFNLSNSYRYQSAGYYVSLLASAREHRAIPSVTTIRDFKNLSVIRSIANDIEELIQESLARVQENRYILNIFFGQTQESVYKNLGHRLYQLFETPLLQVQFLKTDKWMIQKVVPLSFNKIEENQVKQIEEFAGRYFSKKRFQKPRLKHYKYDLAILINPSEANPPSCPQALKHFKEAANKCGFYVDFITRDDYEDICEYDALFIRETTNVNDYTYEFSRRAYAEGLVVIDDPWSILRCANKIYLNERMRQNRIPTPRTEMLAKGVFKKSRALEFSYPMVLKQPDSAFSIGVTKVNNADELIDSLKRLFRKSDMVIAQEFLYSEYDWRIGVLDNLPLFACKYYMAKDHWQIYNWQATKEEEAGDAETVPIEQVPESVLKVALKAAALMGDGLYGVDLKMVGSKVYVIEVNDNPNIDVGIEDAVLKEELYMKVMQSILNRIEVSRNMTRLVAIAPE